jgi:hypothetical protein
MDYRTNKYEIRDDLLLRLAGVETYENIVALINAEINCKLCC